MPPAGKTTASPDPAAWRQFLYMVIIAAAAGQSLAAILTTDRYYTPAAPAGTAQGWPKKAPAATPMFSANDRSRWCTVWALVHEGTYKIDTIVARPGWNTIDKVQIVDKAQNKAHFYSSKPPLLATMVAAMYWALNEIFNFDLAEQPYETIYIMLLVINWLPMIIGLAILAMMVERYAESDIARILVIVAAAFATFWTPFLVTFNNHTIAIFSAICTLYPLLRIWRDGEESPGLYIAAGFFGAFTACNELPAALFGVALFVMLVINAPRPTLRFFIPAALVPVLAFLITNYIAIGEWMPAYSKFGGPAYNYAGSYWLTPKGIDKSKDSWWVYLLNCLIGHHGIFSLTPLWFLTAAAWVRVARAPKQTNSHPLSIVTWLSLGLTVLVLGFYLAQTKSYNYGGMTSGLRWAFWLIPFWLLGLVPIVDEWGQRRWFQFLTVVLLAISVFSVRYPHLNPWQHPWLFKLLESWKLINYS